MNREIKIGIGDEQETTQEFIEAWRRTERREAPTAPEEHLYVPDLETLLGTLTPRRLAVLKTLYARKGQSGPNASPWPSAHPQRLDGRGRRRCTGVARDVTLGGIPQTSASASWHGD